MVPCGKGNKVAINAHIVENTRNIRKHIINIFRGVGIVNEAITIQSTILQTEKYSGNSFMKRTYPFQISLLFQSSISYQPKKRREKNSEKVALYRSNHKVFEIQCYSRVLEKHNIINETVRLPSITDNMHSSSHIRHAEGLSLGEESKGWTRYECYSINHSTSPNHAINQSSKRGCYTHVFLYIYIYIFMYVCMYTYT